MKEEVDALLTALADSSCDGARARMSALLDAIRSPIDERLTRAVLDGLRTHRCFEAMQTFATEAAKVAEGRLLVYVTRQLVQANRARPARRGGDSARPIGRGLGDSELPQGVERGQWSARASAEATVRASGRGRGNGG